VITTENISWALHGRNFAVVDYLSAKKAAQDEAEAAKRNPRPEDWIPEQRITNEAIFLDGGYSEVGHLPPTYEREAPVTGAELQFFADARNAQTLEILEKQARGRELAKLYAQRREDMEEFYLGERDDVGVGAEAFPLNLPSIVEKEKPVSLEEVRLTADIRNKQTADNFRSQHEQFQERGASGAHSPTLGREGEFLVSKEIIAVCQSQVDAIHYALRAESVVLPDETRVVVGAALDTITKTLNGVMSKERTLLRPTGLFESYLPKHGHPFGWNDGFTTNPYPTNPCPTFERPEH
jgi:hypothetical protein